MSCYRETQESLQIVVGGEEFYHGLSVQCIKLFLGQERKKKNLFKGEKNISMFSDHCDLDPQINTYNLF